MKVHYFDPQQGKVTPVASLPAMTAQPGYFWLLCTPADLQDPVFWQQHAALQLIDRLRLELLMSGDQPMGFYEHHPDYELFVFRDYQVRDVSSHWHSHAIVCCLFDQLLMTILPDETMVNSWMNRFQQINRRVPRQVVGLFTISLHFLVDPYLEIRQQMAEQLNRWQQQLLQEYPVKVAWVPLLNYKSNLEQLPLLMEEHFDIVQSWEESEDDYENNDGQSRSDYLLQRLQEIKNHIMRVYHYTYRLDRQLDSMTQLYYSMINHRTNEVLKIIAIISAIFLPLGLLAGIFGMNFKQMSVLSSEYGFPFVLTTMGFVATGMIVWFRKKRWI